MMQKLLITDSDPALCRTLADALGREFCVFSCCDGNAALEIALRECPELMILDLTLPGMDGITLLQKLREASQPTLVLATTVFTSHYVTQCLQSLNVQYLVRKPCTAEMLIQHIRSLSQVSKALFDRIPMLHDRASDLLQEFKISPRHYGCAYIISSILVTLCQPDIRVTKELYPYVGHLHNTTGKLVERDIRNAIEVAWRDRDPAIWQAYFPAETARGKHPTNRVFIARLADHLRRTLQDCDHPENGEADAAATPERSETNQA